MCPGDVARESKRRGACGALQGQGLGWDGKQLPVCGGCSERLHTETKCYLLRHPPCTAFARRAIREYPNLSDYVRDLYQTPGLGAAVNMAHIKTHYFTSHPKLNVHAIIPKGGDPWWEAPHGRAQKFAAAKM